MPETYRIITAAMGLVSGGLIIHFARRNSLYTRFASWWFVLAGLIIVLGLFPRLTDVAARFLDIGYPPAIAFTGAIVFLLIKILLMDIDRSHHESRIRRLTQRLAMLEAELAERDGNDKP